MQGYFRPHGLQYSLLTLNQITLNLKLYYGQKIAIKEQINLLNTNSLLQKYEIYTVHDEILKLHVKLVLAKINSP
jgi:hypothetical protein